MHPARHFLVPAVLLACIALPAADGVPAGAPQEVVELRDGRVLRGWYDRSSRRIVLAEGFGAVEIDPAQVARIRAPTAEEEAEWKAAQAEKRKRYWRSQGLDLRTPGLDTPDKVDAAARTAQASMTLDQRRAWWAGQGVVIGADEGSTIEQIDRLGRERQAAQAGRRQAEETERLQRERREREERDAAARLARQQQAANAGRPLPGMAPPSGPAAGMAGFTAALRDEIRPLAGPGTSEVVLGLTPERLAVLAEPRFAARPADALASLAAAVEMLGACDGQRLDRLAMVQAARLRGLAADAGLRDFAEMVARDGVRDADGRQVQVQARTSLELSEVVRDLGQRMPVLLLLATPGRPNGRTLLCTGLSVPVAGLEPMASRSVVLARDPAAPDLGALNLPLIEVLPAFRSAVRLRFTRW